jgi:hypothetical protein
VHKLERRHKLELHHSNSLQVLHRVLVLERHMVLELHRSSYLQERLLRCMPSCEHASGPEGLLA